MKTKPFAYLLFIALTTFLSAKKVQAQQQQKVIQLYGIVRANDSSSVLPGASVYIKNTRRGTITNDYGIYSIAVLPGTKIEFSFIGFKSVFYTVPNNVSGDQLLISPMLVQDTSYLPTAIVTSLPTPAEFRRMFLETSIPDDNYAIARQNLNLENMLRQMRYLPMDAQSISNMNARELIRQGSQKGLVPSSGIFNPLAWYDFIRSLKEGGGSK
ncbi:MAG TPA: carboxypeptidase-like regulatory domain-containing protein [Arachidicoccus soli]|jgi:hypothetical protein|uniref:Carboxypeptidase-like regulatory domain-containing protein n=1 Tax=Arachidicoccus soli TaxID=2341117 RepID=A0A386HN69_9BACT|nr:carboxypeptidase-like regulatory domain-containing protein [Arachidicoccus soli]AYD47193.1 carboxypeptidase-like regulatory domain-containing protein [Arachidicoccus soli]HEU0227472.1 carboxypeptidase-like regulatory domain-containing protein [Arachidicoccus soli]